MKEGLERRDALEQRIHRPLDPCWVWRGYRTHQGYGIFVHKSRRMYAHRAAYEEFVGPIPDGLEIHHTCFNRCCVNPAHLVATTHAENIALSGSVGAVNRAKTHCPRGHAYDITQAHGGRWCSTCKREYNREYWLKTRPEPRLDRECKNGHPRTDENTEYISVGGRPCRNCLDCKRERQLRARKPPREKPTHCPHGHEYTEENTYRYRRCDSEYFYCRVCNRKHARTISKRRRAA